MVSFPEMWKNRGKSVDEDVRRSAVTMLNCSCLLDIQVEAS